MSIEQLADQASDPGIAIPGEASPEQQPEATAPAIQSVSPEVEARAREMGWRPKDEYHGPADRWRPADEFVRRGEEVLPIVKSQLDKERQKARQLEERLNGVESKLERDYASRFKRLEGMTQVALLKQRQQLWGQFEAEKRKAVESGDTAEYDRLSTAQHQAMVEFQPESDPEEEAPAPVQRPAAHPAAQEFVERNPWFLRDKGMQAVAEQYHVKLFQEKPGISIEDNLREVEKYVRTKFPEAFGGSPTPAPAAPHAPQVEGGTRNAGNVSRGVNDLPPEAKEAGNKFVRQGIYKDIKEYAADYWAQG